jgi:predicted transcriptional regulator
MEVTSIRLESTLKERLKQIAGEQGYQALIRDVLWDFVHQQESGVKFGLSRADILATIPAIAEKEQHCALTGKRLEPQAAIRLGFTRSGNLVPLSLESL